jgi:uracil-DNA glycosylase family protein
MATRSQGRRRRRDGGGTLAPDPQTLDECRRCDLWRNATQAVPGQGPTHSAVMLVGEQPGDEEDLSGLPFVGPAGRLLDRALAQAGIDRGKVFVTNAVKHFKWEPRGKRRLHKKPRAQEVTACNYWLLREIERLKPTLIVAMGTTALSALVGSGITIREARERLLEHVSGVRVVATIHPSAVLRAPPEGRDEMFDGLVKDLKRAVSLAKKLEAE